MSKNLRITLPTNWISAEGECEDYPYRFYPKCKVQNSILDITFAEYKGGKLPNPTYEDLVKLAKGKSNLEIVSVEYGDCKLGKYGTARFRLENVPFFQKWFLSNGKDIVIAEYQSLIEPADPDLQELNLIISSINLVDE